MKPKALLGTAIAFLVTALLVNTFIFTRFNAGDPTAAGTPHLSPVGSILVLTVIAVMMIAWVYGRVQQWMQTALTIALPQIILVDVYNVLNGMRGVTSGIASAVALMIVWHVSSFVYGKLYATG